MLLSRGSAVEMIQVGSVDYVANGRICMLVWGKYRRECGL